jgi:ABC-type multidrug transport system fused ATPase/permease subunit
MEENRNFVQHMESLNIQIRKLVHIYGRQGFEDKLIKDYRLAKFTSATIQYGIKGSSRIIPDLTFVLIVFAYVAFISEDGFQKSDVGDISYMLFYLNMLHGSISNITSSIFDASSAINIIDESDKIITLLKEKHTTNHHQNKSKLKVENWRKGYSSFEDFDRLSMHRNEDQVIELTESTNEGSVFGKKILLSASNLGFFRNGNCLIHNLNLDINTGDFIILVGKSNQGKSRLMHLFSKLLKPTSGSITLNGAPINSLNQKEVSDIVTYIPQEPVVFKDQSVIYNILYTMSSDYTLLKIHDKNAEEIYELLGDCREYGIAVDILNQCQIGHLRYRSDCDLSGGEIKRLAIAMALAKKADLIIFDEATVNLDSANENKIIKVICELKATKIVITHTPEKFVDNDHAKCTKMLELTDEGTLKEIPLNQAKKYSMSA